MREATLLLGEPPTVGRVEDRTVDGPGGPLKVRIYTPAADSLPSRAEPLPLLIYFHGGGWVVGDVDTHDGLCRAIANEGPTIVASVDYRLAPEHPFPAAVEDAYAAVRALHRDALELGGDPAQVCVGGDSAGGNLAAAAALLSRDRGGPSLAWQLLIYPIIDYDLKSSSYRECARGFGLERAEMAWFWNHYIHAEAERVHPLASPIRAENLQGLPPAFILTAEYDVLRDEGERYAKRLVEAGGRATLKRYDGMIHGFLRRYMFFEAGRAALAEVGRELRSATSAPSVGC